MADQKCFCGKNKFHPIKLNALNLPECNYFALPSISVATEEVEGEVSGDLAGGMVGYEQNILEMDPLTLESQLKRDIVIAGDGVGSVSRATSLAAYPSTAHGPNCSSSCLTCSLKSVVKNKMCLDVIGGQKKKVTKKAVEKKENSSTTDGSCDDCIENIEVAIKNLSIAIYDKLKGTTNNRKLTLQQIAEAYHSQNTRLSEENYKKMVTTIVKLFKEQTQNPTHKHPLQVVLQQGKGVNSIRTEIAALDSIVEDNDYNQIVDLSIYQSSEFTDMSDLANGQLKFGGPLDSIDPIIVALFGTKLAGFEDTSVRGDSYTLIKQLYHGGVVEETNSPLFNSRYNDTKDDMIYLAGTTDEFSAEVQRVLMHMMIRKMFVKLRCGDFQKGSLLKTREWLTKMQNDSLYKTKSKEEKFLDMCLRVLGHKSFIIKQSKGEDITSTPYVTIPAHNPGDFSIEPVGITNDLLKQIDFDTFSRRYEVKSLPKHAMSVPHGMYPVKFQEQPSYIEESAFKWSDPSFYQQSSFSFPTHAQTTVTGTGTIVAFVERHKTSRSLETQCFSYKNSTFGSPLAYDKKITTPYGAVYELRSAVCYKPKEYSGFGQSIIEGAPSFAIVQTVKGPWIYDPSDAVTHLGRDQTLTIALKSMYARDDAAAPGTWGTFDEWRTDHLNAEAIAKKTKDIADGKRIFEDGLISQDLADELISAYACVIVYSQDSEMYKMHNQTNGSKIQSLMGCCMV